MGFGAEIKTKREKNTGEILKHVQPHDLLKFGLIPELVGRMPVITTLNSLNREDLIRILTEPKNALTKQYSLLMSYDKVALEFQPEAIEAIADQDLALEICARGLSSIMERIMTKIMYEVPSDPKIEKVIITKECAAGLEPPWIVHKKKPQIDPDAS